VVSPNGVRIRLLAAVALVVGVLGYAVLRGTGSGVVTPTWAGVVLLVFMAAGVYFAALPVKRLREGRATKPISPLRAARSLVLAQAGALTGAGLVGWYAAQILQLVPDLDVDSQRTKALVLAGHAVAAFVLAGAGVLAQRMCRVEPPDDGVGAAQDPGEPGDYRVTR
jgi:hypothetical protein